MTKTAVILFNLGGPDRPEAVSQFLYNLFSDSAIIALPPLLRHILAVFITLVRGKKARHIYAAIGGRSPILEQTNAQAAALQEALKKSGEYKVFVCMRYWHPRVRRVLHEVKQWKPERVVLLPLYPQYSTATTASSLKEWAEHAKLIKFNVPATAICCYPTDPHFIAAHAEYVRDAYFEATQHGATRVLFSAHGLPQKTIDAGDPYAWQVEQTVKAVVQLLAIDELDYAVCYQSRVGPLLWTGPSAEEEIRRAGSDKKNVVVVPVAFVSEHSETLYELDILYAAQARECGVKYYKRVPALGVNVHFVQSLADICRNAGADDAGGVCSAAGGRLCPRPFAKCPYEEAHG